MNRTTLLASTLLFAACNTSPSAGPVTEDNFQERAAQAMCDALVDCDPDSWHLVDDLCTDTMMNEVPDYTGDVCTDFNRAAAQDCLDDLQSSCYANYWEATSCNEVWQWNDNKPECLAVPGFVGITHHRRRRIVRTLRG